MCHTFRQDFLVHLRHVTTTLHEKLSLKSTLQPFIVYSHWVHFFFIYFCVQMYVRFLEPVFILVSQHSQPELGLKDKKCVCLCKAHTCLLARACVLVCVISNISTLPCRLYPTCHHTRQEIMTCARGGVSPKEVPWQTLVVEPRPSSRQNPLNTDLSQTAHSENDFQRFEMKPVWLIPLCKFDLFVHGR